MDDTVIIMRMVERITVVLIGGLAIYFGYRLFFHLPFQHDNKGQLELPGVKIVLSRVGPGVFFAAFGTLVLFYSLTTPIKITQSTAPAYVEKSSRDTIYSSGFTGVSGKVASNSGISPQQRSQALITIEMLNCARRLLKGGGVNRDLQDQLSLAIRDSKRALLLSVWDENDWGSTGQFSVTGPTNKAPFQVKSIFNATYEDCPE